MAQPKPESDKELKKIYYDTSDAGSYGGINRLLKRGREKGDANVNTEKVAKFLRNQHSYSLHKPMRKNFKRNKTIVGGIDRQWQADLADMQSISEDNDGMHYLMTVIDVFSKYAWVVAIKDKGAKSMLQAFKDLLAKSAPRKPQKIQTDAGLEFTNRQVQKFFRDNQIEHFISNSDMKAAVVERFNRTLKTRIWTFFSAKQTHRYIDALEQFVDAYNHSMHRTIGMKPVDVRPEDEDRLFMKMFGDTIEARPGKNAPLEPGKMVRISKVKGDFEKGYMPNWSTEHFNVEKQNSTGSKVLYKLRDFANEEIKGSFYPEEVQAIDHNRYLIEKVLKRRKKKGRKKELFVKWLGWPTKFNTWIPESDPEPITNNQDE